MTNFKHCRDHFAKITAVERVPVRSNLKLLCYNRHQIDRSFGPLVVKLPEKMS